MDIAVKAMTAVILFLGSVAVLAGRLGFGSTYAQLSLLAVLIIATVSYIGLIRPPAGIGLGMLAFVYLVLALPTIYAPGVPGIDVWSYLGTTKFILEHGWQFDTLIVDPNSNLFPGNQFHGAILVHVLDIPLFDVAAFQPHALKLSALLCVYILGRRAGLTVTYALVPPTLLVAYTVFATYPPYHHITAGFSLKFLTYFCLLYFLISTQHKRAGVVFTVAFLGLLVSHQLSTIHIAIICGVTLAFAAYYYLSTHDHPPLRPLYFDGNQLRYVSVLLVLFGVLLLWYYVTVGEVYFRRAFINHIIGGVGGPSNPDPFLVSRLTYHESGSFLERVSQLAYPVRHQYSPIAAVGFFSLLFAGVVIYRSRIVTHSLHPRELARIYPLEIMLSAWGLAIFMTRFFPFLGLGFWGGSPRLAISAVPLVAIAALCCLQRVGVANLPDRIRRVGVSSVAFIVVLFIFVSVSLYPAYFFAVEDSAGLYGNRQVYTDEHQLQTYEFIDDGTVSASDTEGFYYRGYRYDDDITPIRGEYPFAGEIEPDSGLYLIWQDSFYDFIPTRSQHQYGVPEEIHAQYGQEWNRIYSTDTTEIYDADGSF
ncbi:hypothetical protein [Natrinema soli]|uniref:Glycosyltransferase RgtA/B/C/D-like domain-containing protein n=1 Tax=Natrinema soli TaxID=1930624 RepID=A0ABD5SK45_9EURY|nr:hypothetical protein [Natrinema soli]